MHNNPIQSKQTSNIPCTSLPNSIQAPFSPHYCLRLLTLIIPFPLPYGPPPRHYLRPPLRLLTHIILFPIAFLFAYDLPLRPCLRLPMDLATSTGDGKNQITLCSAAAAQYRIRGIWRSLRGNTFDNSIVGISPIREEEEEEEGWCLGEGRTFLLI